MNDINKRFRDVIDVYNYTPAQFADLIGAGRSLISHVLSGRNRPGLELLQKVLRAFPDVQAQWLLMGTGPMTGQHDQKAPTHTDQPTQEDLSPSDGEASTHEYQSEGSVETARADRNHTPTKKAVTIKDQEEAPERDASNTKEIPSRKPDQEAPKSVASRKLVRVLLIFDDGTFEESQRPTAARDNMH